MQQAFFPCQQGSDANIAHYPQQLLERGVRATVIGEGDFYTKNCRNEGHIIADGSRNGWAGNGVGSRMHKRA